MPSGVYLRTEKHSFNKGRKHPNRKRFFKGITLIHKVCPFCKKEFTTDSRQPKKKFCSLSCSSKSRPEMNIANLEKRDREHQRAVVSARKGNKHHNWIEDRSLLKDEHRDRKGQLHKEWSNRVKERDNWQCCYNNDDCNGRIESHHILSWKDYENLRYEISNGITVCHFHHPKTRLKEKELIPFFKTKIDKIVAYSKVKI